MRERAEEMERMREHVFKEADTNQDHLISYEEFIDQTKRAEFQQDQKWDTVDNAPQYTHEEYLDYERKRQEEIQRLISEGLLPPHPNMPGGYHPGPGQPMYQQHPNEIPHYQQQQYHGNQYPPQQNHHEAARMADSHHQAQQMHYEQQKQMQHPNGQQFQGQQQYHPQPPPQGQGQPHPNVQQVPVAPPQQAQHVNPPPPPAVPVVPQTLHQQGNVQPPPPKAVNPGPPAAAAPQAVPANPQPHH